MLVVDHTDALDVPRSHSTVRGGAAHGGAGVPQVWQVGRDALQIRQAYHAPCGATDTISFPQRQARRGSPRTRFPPNLRVLGGSCTRSLRSALTSSWPLGGGAAGSISSTREPRVLPPLRRSCRSSSAADTTSCGPSKAAVCE